MCCSFAYSVYFFTKSVYAVFVRCDIFAGFWHVILTLGHSCNHILTLCLNLTDTCTMCCLCFCQVWYVCPCCLDCRLDTSNVICYRFYLVFYFRNSGCQFCNLSIDIFYVWFYLSLVLYHLFERSLLFKHRMLHCTNRLSHKRFKISVFIDIGQSIVDGCFCN